MKLYEHQQKIIREDKSVTGLFLGTGSGKTRIALLLARGKTLVICPKTQKEDKNWERESHKLQQEYIGAFSLTVISKEEFRRDHKKLLAFDTVIVDEAHTCLGATPNVRWVKKQPIPKCSQLFEALESFIARTKPSRIYLCTATIVRSPMTVWAAGKILGQKWDFYKWRDTFYFRLPMPGREVFQAKNDEFTKSRLAEVVRKLGYTGRLEDFFDVPDQVFRTDHIALTEKQKARIKEMPFEYPEPIVRVGKIHQIENGVLAGDEFSAPEYFENAKIDQILDYAIEFPRIVVFAKYKAQIAAIEAALRQAGRKVLVMTGDTKDRGALLLEANKAKECVFIAQSQISSGWELPGYPVMIFASKTYSFVDLDQSLGRIQRANNIKKNLYISLVTKGGVDEAVEKCLAEKVDFNEKIYAEKLS